MRVLVIGDACRDVFVYCDSNRLCPDVPVPVLNVVDQTENPGMARNVQRNIRALGVRCDALTNANWHDITKTRYVHRKSNHAFFRVDSSEQTSRIDLKLIDWSYDAIIVSDYNKGFLHEEDIQAICERHSSVFVDTKKILGDWIKSAKFIKLNDSEYKNSQSAINLLNLGSKIIHTMGDLGCMYDGRQYSTEKVNVRDVSGAGDTFISGLVVKYLCSGSIEEAILFANKCASDVVRYRGVTIPRGIE